MKHDSEVLWQQKKPAEYHTSYTTWRKRAYRTRRGRKTHGLQLNKFSGTRQAIASDGTSIWELFETQEHISEEPARKCSMHTPMHRIVITTFSQIKRALSEDLD